MDKLLSGAKALIIRSFRADDQEEVRALILSGLGDHFGMIDESLNPDLDDISAHYLAPGHDFVIAERGGALVGTGGLIREDEETGRLVRMSVRRNCRRQGIGSKLVEHLLLLAQRRQLVRVLVETDLNWDDAIRLYQGHGFVTYAEDEESVHMAVDLY